MYEGNLGLVMSYFQLSFSFSGLITLRCDPFEKLEVFVKHYMNERLKTFKVDGFFVIISSDG